MFILKKLAFLLMSCTLLLSSGVANALLTNVDGLLTQVSIQLDEGGDCTGYFGNGSDCIVTYVPDASSPIFANILGKFDVDNAIFEESPDGISADQWTFNGEDANPGESEGTWAYQGNESYPNIKFWVAKAGNTGFILHWMINDTDISQCQDPNVEFSISCLSAAVSVSSGSWLNPYSYNDLHDTYTKADLSHLTFYGAKPAKSVTEPETFALFALALVGLSLQRKRRIKS